MPNIGETISTDNIGGKVSSQKRLYVWMACPYCEKERWVRKYYDGKPMSGCCIGCGNKHIQKRKAEREEHGRWNGGKKRKNDYIHVRLSRDDVLFPMTHSDGYVQEHRLVMARHLGRCLEAWEIVHHKGDKYPLGSIENKQDNRIENLQLLPKAVHLGIENAQRVFRKLKAENTQLREQLKHRLDRPVREKIAKWLYKDDYPGEADVWETELGRYKVRYYEKADQIGALIPDIETLDRLRDRLTELEKKLDDREADLIEAKREEGERILAIIRDWDTMIEEEGGEEKWQKKYGLPSTDLVQVLEQALYSLWDCCWDD